MIQVTSGESVAERAVAEYLNYVVDESMTAQVAGLFAEDAVFEFPFAPVGVPKVISGRNALSAHVAHFPKTFDVRFVELTFHATASPFEAVVDYRAEGTVRATGKAYPQTSVSIVQTNADGLIVHFRDYWNPLIAIEAMTPRDASVTLGEVQFGDN
ncbi:hypothetical protein AX769_05705 [Frondihabitans sp. PAMC 28766]|uniref:nuclear transport factor 2 family protein n=1 Tax=Frondihabitans sp. PAMC 28766 TaxID=1795630 RepID=UPI00078C594B|nr:nuclear transport factor 2 family protein [Frondihabitans sp. PAMC 28766]AMM19733.1 hypothetical protein AX769_05705 [Frondihabitans sp. PAMC 28766]